MLINAIEIGREEITGLHCYFRLRKKMLGGGSGGRRGK